MPSFGLSTHLFHNERLTRAHLETIAAHGFTLVEIFATRTHVDYHDRSGIDDLAGWLVDLGLTAGSLHAPVCASFLNGRWGRVYSNASARDADRQEAVAETTAAMEAAGRLGCRDVVLHLGVPKSQAPAPAANDAGAAVRSLEALATSAQAMGLRLALEVMPNALSTPDALVDLIDRLDLPGVGVCLDFGHAHLMGGAPEAAEAISGHLMTTHVHDNRGVLDNHLVPFEGTIDWAAALTASWKVGYDGALIFEVADHGDPLATLARTVGARTRLQAILEDLAQPFF